MRFGSLLSLFSSVVIFGLGLPAQAADALTETRIQRIVSVFENSTSTIQYDYVENLNDGRGYTAGESGFTTATGDLLDVVQEYLRHKSSPSWTALLPTLQHAARSESASVTGLENLPRLWKSSAREAEFIRAQEKVTDDLYRGPARRELARFGFSSALAELVFYDAMIQHGDGDDSDSFSGIVRKMRDRPKTEAAFMIEFLRAREIILNNPSDHDSTAAWRESIDRVHALTKLVNDGRWSLAPPFKVHVWDEDFNFAR